MNRKGIWIAALVLLALACTNKQDKAVVTRMHAAASSLAGVMVWADPLPCSQVMQASQDGSELFRCFRIGRIDSAGTHAPDPKRQTEAAQYWQHEMWKDWALFMNGDTIRPVFHEVAVALNAAEQKAVLVFEISEDIPVDTLLFRDRYNGNYIHQLIISRN